jgi:hypothetical protein
MTALNRMNDPRMQHSVFVDDIYLRGNPVLSAGRDLLKKYTPSNFQIATTPEEASIILYLEHGYLGLAELPQLLNRIRAVPGAQHFVFSESDWPFPVLPGAYPSLSKSCPWAHSWSYLSSVGLVNRDNANSGETATPHLLFSFLGRVATHPVRKELLKLNGPDTPCMDISDAPKRFSTFHPTSTYVGLLKSSQFVLCPRGFGASSIRIFEAMSFGRAPVIISDQWQPPPGIPWEEICIRVRESKIANIPKILENFEGKARSMGQKAREIYQDHFAANVFFDRLLARLVDSYSHYSNTTEANVWRAFRAVEWREVKTLCHQARSVVLDSV